MILSLRKIKILTFLDFSSDSSDSSDSDSGTQNQALDTAQVSLILFFAIFLAN